MPKIRSPQKITSREVSDIRGNAKSRTEHATHDAHACTHARTHTHVQAHAHSATTTDGLSQREVCGNKQLQEGPFFSQTGNGRARKGNGWPFELSKLPSIATVPIMASTVGVCGDLLRNGKELLEYGARVCAT